MLKRNEVMQEEGKTISVQGKIAFPSQHCLGEWGGRPPEKVKLIKFGGVGWKRWPHRPKSGNSLPQGLVRSLCSSWAQGPRVSHDVIILGFVQVDSELGLGGTS